MHVDLTVTRPQEPTLWMQKMPFQLKMVPDDVIYPPHTAMCREKHSDGPGLKQSQSIVKNWY